MLTEHSPRWPGVEGLNLVVTGGASGIGCATAKLAASLGANVGVHYRSNRRGAMATVDTILESGGAAWALQGDLRVPRDRQTMIERCWDKGRVDAWVHCAGADVLTGEEAKLAYDEKLRLLWSVDVEGTALLAREVAQRMLGQPIGALTPAMVFIGWDQAYVGMEGEPGQIFGPVKAAVASLSNNLAQTFAAQIRVNCVAPGWIRTAWGERADDYWSKRAAESSLMQRWGTADDVANAIVFLCSPAASFINGQVLDVNGGWSRRFR